MKGVCFAEHLELCKFPNEPHSFVFCFNIDLILLPDLWDKTERWIIRIHFVGEAKKKHGAEAILYFEHLTSNIPYPKPLTLSNKWNPFLQCYIRLLGTITLSRLNIKIGQQSKLQKPLQKLLEVSSMLEKQSDWRTWNLKSPLSMEHRSSATSDMQGCRVATRRE